MAIIYGIVITQSVGGTFRLIFWMVFVDFILVGFVVATFGWFMGNRFLLSHSSYSTEQKIEWQYSFDIHCNSFFPVFLLTYVLQVRLSIEA